MMTQTAKLSILDQSLRYGEQSTQDALRQTVRNAQICESLGYHRFWVSEHHASGLICGSAPEVLLAAIGAVTETIRLGSGGVMLPHYNAYKVAEQFAVLSNLYPDRVDLGVGRAPGADMVVARALAKDGKPDFHQFPQQVQMLGAYLDGSISQPPVTPAPCGNIPIWMLGTSEDSARLAGALGLPYALALFINPQADERLVELYRQSFRSSALWPEPYVMIATTGLAAETEEKAKFLQKSFYVNYVRILRQGSFAETVDPQQAQDHMFDPQEAAFVGTHARRSAFGTAEQVKEKLDEMAAQFGADEIMMSCNSYDVADRNMSLELVAGIYDLRKPG